MAKQEEAWEVRWELRNEGDGMTVARGHIKDYPSAEEALDRLGERVGTAVSAELRPLADPAPWRLVLSFEVSRRAEQLASGIDLAAEALAIMGLRDTRRPAATADEEDSGFDLCVDPQDHADDDAGDGSK